MTETARQFGTQFARVAMQAAVLASLPLFLDPYWQQFGYRALQLFVLASAWNLLAGYAGQVSLGTAAFVGLGAYAMALISNHTGTSFIYWLPACGLVAAAFAVLVSPGMFRLRGLYFTIGSLALAEALRILMVNSSAFGGTRGIILNAPAASFATLYWIALLLALIAELALLWILLRPVALALQAVRDDEEVAKQMGVRTFHSKLLAFVISAALMGMAGGLQAIKLGAIEPYGAFALSWTIDTTAVVIIGGLGTRWGPVLGTLIYVTLSELLRGLPELHGAITGMFLLLVIRFAPHGVSGLLARHLRRKLMVARDA